MKVFNQDWDLTRGIALVGSFESKEDILNQIREHVHDRYGEKLQEKTLSSDLIKKLSDSHSREFQEIFMQNVADDNRKYTYSEIEQNAISDNTENYLTLLSQARPMKHVIVSVIEKPSKLSKDLRDGVFGNTANFIIGAMSNEDKALMKQVLPNINLIEGDYNMIVSFIDQNHESFVGRMN